METTILNIVGAASPIVAGIVAIVWLLWRLFWKVDRRSQQEVLNLIKRNKVLETEISEERTLRFAAEVNLARANAREAFWETQESELHEQISRITTRNRSLEQQLTEARNRMTPDSNGGSA
jgi:hypothetical protein